MAQTLTNLNINDNNAVISALREGMKRCLIISTVTIFVDYAPFALNMSL